MYQQIYDPIANNLVLSAVVALIPMIVLFVLLAGRIPHLLLALST